MHLVLSISLSDKTDALSAGDEERKASVFPVNDFKHFSISTSSLRNKKDGFEHFNTCVFILSGNNMCKIILQKRGGKV